MPVFGNSLEARAVRATKKYRKGTAARLAAIKALEDVRSALYQKAGNDSGLIQQANHLNIHRSEPEVRGIFNSTRSK